MQIAPAAHGGLVKNLEAQHFRQGRKMRGLLPGGLVGIPVQGGVIQRVLHKAGGLPGLAVLIHGLGVFMAPLVHAVALNAHEGAKAVFRRLLHQRVGEGGIQAEAIACPMGRAVGAGADVVKARQRDIPHVPAHFAEFVPLGRNGYFQGMIGSVIGCAQG